MDAAGSLHASVDQMVATNNVLHGVDFDENADGDLTAVVAVANASNNSGAGVRADEGSTGSGSVTLKLVTLSGNGLGPTSGHASVAVLP